MAAPSQRSERLAEKLREIRTALGLSQTEMLKRLGFDATIFYTRISDYELGKRVPPLRVILEYARVAGVLMEDLVDDELDLPTKLAANIRHQAPKRRSKSRTKR